MNKTYKLVRKIVAEQKYKVIDDDGENIAINYQLNTIFFFMNLGDKSFVSIVLPDFAYVTEENFHDVVMNCHWLNSKVQQVKYYTIDEYIVAASEFYYKGKGDLEFQILKALDNLVAAKVSYNRMAGT